MTGIQEAPVHALLADGTTVRIRPAGPADHEEVQRLYEEMSPQNLRLRFFSLNPASARQAADRVVKGERPGYRALAAECGGRLVGLAEYQVLPGGGTAEISVAVADDWHHRGVGTLLLEHLADAARTAGISAFSADVRAASRRRVRSARSRSRISRPGSRSHSASTVPAGRASPRPLARDSTAGPPPRRTGMDRRPRRRRHAGVGGPIRCVAPARIGSAGPSPATRRAV